MGKQGIVFYTDENVDNCAVEIARSRGVEIVTVRDTGLLGASDPSLFTYAIEHSYTFVVGSERDFRSLYADWTANGLEHPGVFFITNRHLKNTHLIADTLWLWHAAGTRADVRNLMEWI